MKTNPPFLTMKSCESCEKSFKPKSLKTFCTPATRSEAFFSGRRGDLITALDSIFQKCPDEGVEEIVMGMAHRGRLNVLSNAMGKSYEFIFREFSENFVPDGAHGSGDASITWV